MNFNKRNFFVFLFIFFLSLPTFAQSQPLTMIFIQPGGEGSMEEAQPILDEFFRLIQKNGGPMIKGKYYPLKEEGLRALTGAHLAIVSPPLFDELQKKGEVILSTISAASNSPDEFYHFLVHQDSPKNILEDKLMVYSSEPLGETFLKEKIFSKWNHPLNLENKPNSQILSVLRKVAQKEITGGVLLNNFEYQSFEKTNLEWKKNLKTIYKSPPLLSAPLVLLKDLPEEQKKSLINSLLQINKTEEGKEVLESLRLKGFVLP